jgi:hypothetical protein
MAHYETRPGTPGAVCNASGVSVLLGLLARLRGWRTYPIILGVLQGGELFGAGSRHCRDVLLALGVLTRLRGVVDVSWVGVSGPGLRPDAAPPASGLTNLVDRAGAGEGLRAVVSRRLLAGAVAALERVVRGAGSLR